MTGEEGGWSTADLCLVSKSGNLHGFSGHSPVPIINHHLHCRIERLKGARCRFGPEEMVCCENRVSGSYRFLICLEKLLRLARKQYRLLGLQVSRLRKCVFKW